MLVKSPLLIACESTAAPIIPVFHTKSGVRCIITGAHLKAAANFNKRTWASIYI